MSEMTGYLALPLAAGRSALPPLPAVQLSSFCLPTKVVINDHSLRQFRKVRDDRLPGPSTSGTRTCLQNCPEWTAVQLSSFCSPGRVVINDHSLRQ